MQYFTGPWPHGKRGVVCLSFDCDFAYAYTKAPRPTATPPDGPALINKRPRSLSGYSRGLYGLHVGLPRITAFLDKERIKGTFFVPSANLERYPAVFQAVAQAGHELGAHGHEHENLADMREDPAAEAAILAASLGSFRRHLGAPPQGYRSPAWDMNAHSPRLLQEAGFLYDSSLFAGEAPYSMAVYDPAVSVLELPIDWSLDDAAYFLFFKPPASMAQFHDPDEVFRIWRAELDGVVEGGGVFTLTCHPSVIGRHHRLAILSLLVAHARRRGDVWFAAMAEVASHVRQAWPAAA